MTKKRKKEWAIPASGLLCLFFAAALLAAAVPGQARADITVGIIGDQFGVNGAVGTEAFNRNLEKAYRAMADGVAALNKAGSMDTVLHVGDLVESAQSDTEIRKNFNHAADILDNVFSRSRPKWFLTPGDHDVNPPEWAPDSADRSKEQVFKSLYQTVNPGSGRALYYSFDIKGYHFVALYSLEHLCTDPRWGNVYLAKISDAQLEWLKKDLAEAAVDKGVIVFTHQPLWYNWGSWSRVHEVLARYNTKVVVAGHLHYDQRDAAIDGIRYCVVGATGGAVKTANARAGGWWHVSRLTLSDSGRVSWDLIPVDGGPKDRPTPRYDMDRVQALDYTLGNAAQWLSAQRVYVKEGELVGRDGKKPAGIVLAKLGNPIDETVFTTIKVTAPGTYAIRSGRFAAGICEGPAGSRECRVKAGANIVLSNNAMVNSKCSRYSPDFSCCREYKPFWSGVLTPVASAPKAGDKIILTITMSYSPGKGKGDLVIWRDVPIQVRAFP